MQLNQYQIGLRQFCHQSYTHPRLVFIKARYIGENIRIIQECIEHLNDKNKPGLFFFADFEKAYDSIDQNYMYKCLGIFNFGKSFIKGVNMFYSFVCIRYTELSHFDCKLVEFKAFSFPYLSLKSLESKSMIRKRNKLCFAT